MCFAFSDSSYPSSDGGSGDTAQFRRPAVRHTSLHSFDHERSDDLVQLFQFTHELNTPLTRLPETTDYFGLPFLG